MADEHHGAETGGVKASPDLRTPSTASRRHPAVRALRVGLLSTLLVGGYWVGVNAWMARDACDARQTVPYPCLGAAVLVVLGGLPLLALSVALLLAGRGFLHAVAGGLVSVVLGTAVVYELLSILDFGGPDAVGWAMTAPAVGLVAAVWSVTVPGRSSRGSQAARSLA